jgi:hypothetical protein
MSDNTSEIVKRAAANTKAKEAKDAAPVAKTMPWLEYQKLPEDKRSRPLTSAEYDALTPQQRQAAGLEDTDEGAPADFNGPVLSNPDHIKPHLDTDPLIPPTRLPKNTSFHKDNWHGDPQMDVSNPATSEIIPPKISLYDRGGIVDVHDGRHQLAVLEDGERVLNPRETAAYEETHGKKGPTKMKANISKIDLFDAGGTVPDSEGREGESLAEKAKTINALKAQDAAPTAQPVPPARPYVPSQKDKVNPKAKYGDRPGEKRLKLDEMPRISVFDDGGEVSADDAKGGYPRIVLPAPAEPVASDSTETAVQPREMSPEEKAVDTDKKAAFGAGRDGLAKLGTALIHEKLIKDAPAQDAETPAPGFPKIKSAASSVVDPATLALIPGTPENRASMPRYGGPGKSVAQGDLIPTDQLGSDEKKYASQQAPAQYKAKLADYDSRIQAALDEATPEGQEKADRLTAAKQAFQKANPWGSAANHPGVLGKIGHIAEMVAQRAPGIAPIVSTIPGSEVYRGVESAGTRERLKEDTQLAAKEAPKQPRYEMKETVDNRQGSPTFGQTVWAGVNENNPADVRYSGAQVAPKAGDEKNAPASADQIADYQQRIKNSGLTGDALTVYGNTPKGATAAELDKRFDEATKLRGMNAADQRNKIDEQQRIDNANEHKRESDRTSTNSVYERVRAPYVTSLGKLQSTLDSSTAAATDLQSGSPVGQAIGVVKTLSALASGSGSGVRITQAELNNLMDARIGGHSSQLIEKYFSGKSLTDAQVKDVQGLLADVQARVSMKEHVLNHGLDKMNYANSDGEIKKIDTDIRKNLANVESIPVGDGLLVNDAGEPIGYVDAKGTRTRFKQ